MVFIQGSTNNACFPGWGNALLARAKVAASDFHRRVFPCNSHLGRAGKTANAASIITSHSIWHIRGGIRKCERPCAAGSDPRGVHVHALEFHRRNFKSTRAASLLSFIFIALEVDRAYLRSVVGIELTFPTDLFRPFPARQPIKNQYLSSVLSL